MAVILAQCGQAMMTEDGDSTVGVSGHEGGGICVVCYFLERKKRGGE